MRRQRLAALLLTLAGMVVAGVAGWRSAPRAMEVTVVAECALPAPRYAAYSFIQMLADCGLESAVVSPVHLSDFLNLLPSDAYGIRTNRGTMSAAFFPAPIEGTVKIRPAGVLSWELDGLSSRPQRFGSNHPLYFITDQNLLLIIDDESLYNTMRSLLHAKE